MFEDWLVTYSDILKHEESEPESKPEPEPEPIDKTLIQIL